MESEYRTADTLGERAKQSRIKLRLFVEADRTVVVALLAAVVFGALVAIGTAYPTALADLRAGDPVGSTFQAMLGAVVTGVTIVVTLNQLVLSQEFGPAGDQRERMDGTMDFREAVADAIGSPVSPPEPTTFTRALIEVIADRASDASEGIAGDAHGAPGVEISALADGIESDAATASERLEGARFGQFEFLSAALDFNYSWKLFGARRVRADRADELTDDQRAALDELIEALELFGVTREHLKTLYIRWELVSLSRTILLSAIPALLVAIGMLYYFDPGRLTGAVAGLSVPILVVSAAVTITLVPFLVLISYVFRLATVVQQTLAIGPFVLHEEYPRTDLDWD